MSIEVTKEAMPFQILSLSGGGVRGLYTITVLAELEQHMADETDSKDYWIGQHFDLITGTSIGGILALALAYGVTARELKDVLDANRKDIFPQPSGCFKKVRRLLKTICDGQYSPTPLRQAIEKVVDQKTIGDLKTRILVPTINASTGLVQTFKTPHHEDLCLDWKVKIVDVALATSAAPTYFPAHRIGKRKYVDGGLAANSPALMAYHEARHFLSQESSLIRILSIGTMGQNQTLQEHSEEKYGYAAWGFGKTLIAMSLSSTESLHNQIVSHLLPPENMRFIDDPLTPDQSKNELSLDNASDNAANILMARAESKAQYLVNDEFFQSVVNHVAPPPRFYYGPNKNMDSEDS